MSINIIKQNSTITSTGIPAVIDNAWDNSLPSGYTRLESITFPSGAYLTTNIIPTTYDYEVTFKGSFGTIGASSPLCAYGYMGTVGSGTLPRYLLATYNSQWLSSPNWTTPTGTADTNAHTFVTEVYDDNGTPKWRFSIDGTTLQDDQTMVTTGWTSNTLPFYIGARNNNGTAGNYGLITVRQWSVKKAGVLVANYIPAKHDSDSVLGMYDLVNDVFYTNQGTGTLTAGREIQDALSDYTIEGRTVQEKYVLPDNLIQVDYIQSSGTQYIDTGVTYSTVSELSGSTVDFQIVSLSGNRAAVACARNYPDWNSYMAFVDDGAFATASKYGVAYSQTADIYARTTTTFGTCADVTTNPVLLFAYMVTTPSPVGSVKIYSAKFKSNDILVRNFIPVLNTTTNEYCMYDTVNKVVYTNQGTGSFTGGYDYLNSDSCNVPSPDNVVELHSVGDLVTDTSSQYYGKYAIPITHKVTHNLPSTYEELEYIESTGTQYINTGIVPTVDSGVKIKYAYPTVSSSINAGICGTYAPGTPRTDALFISTSSGKTNSYIIAADRGSINSASSIQVVADEIYTVSINYKGDNTINVNNQLTTTIGTGTVTTTNNIYLFARCYNGTYANTNAKIYNAIFSEGTAITHNFIPAKRKSDNVVGMYDTMWTGNQYGCVDMGSLTWTYYTNNNANFFYYIQSDATLGTNIYVNGYTSQNIITSGENADKLVYVSGSVATPVIRVTNHAYTDATAFKEAMSGVLLYYQRTTDTEFHSPFFTNAGTGDFTGNEIEGETNTIYANESLRGVDSVKDTLNYATGTITRNIKSVTLSAGTHTLSDAKSNGNYLCSQQVGGTLTGQTLVLETGVTNAEVIYELATATTESVTCPTLDIELNNLTNSYEVTSDVKSTLEAEFIGDITEGHNIYYNSKYYPVKYNNKNY